MIDNLLVNFHPDGLSLQQALKGCLHIRAAFPQQLPHQAVGAGVGPVCADPALLKEIDDGPGVVDILFLPECETVIPVFHLLNEIYGIVNT